MTVTTTFGEITASKDTLNYLSMAFFDAADLMQARSGIENREVFGYERTANEIFDALDKTGYYNEYQQADLSAKRRERR